MRLFLQPFMQQCFLFILLNLSFGLSLIQAQTAAPTQQGQQEKTMPNDYPKYIDTGNPQQDNQKYTEAKRVWITANPQAYAKMTGQQQAAKSENQMENKIKTTQNVSTAKPSEMIPPYNPQLTTLPAETPKEHLPKPIETIEPFADSPKYTDTGKPDADQQRYDLAKEAWIKANPEKYAAINSAPPTLLVSDVVPPVPLVAKQIAPCSNCLKSQQITIWDNDAAKALESDNAQKIRDEIAETILWLDTEKSMLYLASSSQSVVKIIQVRIEDDKVLPITCTNCDDSFADMLISEKDSESCTLLIKEHSDNDIWIKIKLKR